MSITIKDTKNSICEKINRINIKIYYIILQLKEHHGDLRKSIRK